MDGWLSLQCARTATSGVGAPGLWKTVRRDGRSARCFDVPLKPLLLRLDTVDDEDGVEREIVEWATTTRRGSLPDGWAPPDSIAAAIPAAALSFRRGSFMQQAQLVSGPERLAVEVTIAPVSPSLKPARRRWLRRLLDDATRLRMVRVQQHRDGADRRRIVAAVDLTGAPAIVAADLAAIGVDALRHVYEQLVATATLLGDADVPIHLEPT